MFETKIKKNNLKRIVYIIGALIEILGFALLFSFDKTMVIIHQYKIIFSFFFIITGYIIAIGVRRII